MAKEEKVWQKFVFGGFSGMAATLVVQPVDLIKNRMQMSGVGVATKAYRNSFHALTSIVKSEGVLSLYQGLSAGLFRQATYATSRLGFYSGFMEHFEPKSFLGKSLAGLAAGGLGAIIGTPADVALIRMTTDGRLPVHERRNYKNVFNALSRISKEEGFFGLWRGCQPTVVRAMVINAAQLATYSQSKQQLLTTKYFNDPSSIGLHFTSSLISGFACTCASMPVDITKTRIQTMKIINGVPEYSGVTDVLIKVIRNEGVTALWKGFTPYFLRVGPHTTLSFIVLEALNNHFAGGGHL